MAFLNQPRTELISCSHIPGQHRSTSSLCDFSAMMESLSEAMVLGLGSGLGFFYRVDQNSSPDLETIFYKNIGCQIHWAGKWDSNALAQSLSEGRPVLAQTKIYHLPYYQPPVHFPGHAVVVAAIDLEHETISLADTISEQLQTISLKSFHDAMNIDSPPMMQAFRWVSAPKLTEKVISISNLKQAIRRMTINILNPSTAFEGLTAL